MLPILAHSAIAGTAWTYQLSRGIPCSRRDQEWLGRGTILMRAFRFEKCAARTLLYAARRVDISCRRQVIHMLILDYRGTRFFGEMNMRTDYSHR